MTDCNCKSDEYCGDNECKGAEAIESRYHPFDWAPREIADRQYPVSASHVYEVGGEYYGRKIVGINFYTGFPGCPTRYYIKTEDGRVCEHRDESSTPTMWSKN